MCLPEIRISADVGLLPQHHKILLDKQINQDMIFHDSAHPASSFFILTTNRLINMQDEQNTIVE